MKIPPILAGVPLLGATSGQRKERKKAPYKRGRKVGPFSGLRHLMQPDQRTKQARQIKEQRAALIAQAGGSPSASQQILVERIIELSLRLDELARAVATSDSESAIWHHQQASTWHAALLAFIKEFHAACPPPPPPLAAPPDAESAAAAREKLLALLLDRSAPAADIPTDDQPAPAAEPPASAAAGSVGESQASTVQPDAQAPAAPASAPPGEPAKPSPLAAAERWRPPPWAVPWP